mmetsp:Transcript_24918/g.53082  ORF Transcript_24918/g.53082 Transcript_24918/m.53082 type:complete len:176 (+) Transcript_24918:208-735(+)|eukprot:CAMPEP_0201265754 /NCGR_PEP_ID=MMETSP0853-20130426/16951_1 /ASSEMBLY_ACC=CAM_ASM_000640 /TAXON_ID=183588 /ORGANISM="Pseudo-nitzschia fraudulenta, Strain WWA7" /LENGTH=175 /DNA_ID=CAMNT_0047570357 /DNA_START=122 /DNA_END=649 /DNA_ORIENTATION=-
MSSVSSFRINFWVAVLLAVTVFSGFCVDESMAFTTTTKITGAQQWRSSSATTGAFSPLSAPSCTCLGSTVVDSPTETDTKIEITKDEVTEKQEQNGKNGWEIQLFNDPFNHRTFVAKCLCTICGKSDTESYQIMMQAHKNGMGVVGRYHYEIAELYYGSLKEEGLTVRMVEVDEE